MAIQWMLHVTTNVTGYNSFAVDSEKDARSRYRGICNLLKHPTYKGEAKVIEAFIEAPNGKKTWIKKK